MFSTSFLALSLLSAASAAPYFKVTNDASSSAEWDYIVAGGGPSGMIVAERLAEKNYNVLLLEGGGPSTHSSGGTAAPTWNGTGMSIYDIASQNGAIFATGASHLCTNTAGTAACLLGGGVEINAMVFVPPPDHDFDDKWPVGWKWSDIEASANALYERNPPTTTPSMDGERYDLAEYTMLGGFLDTLGYNEVNPIEDPNSKFEVYTHPPWNIQNGERGGPIHTYLPLVQNATNFSLQMHTKVLQVVRSGSQITGVLVENTQTGVRSTISIKNSGRVVLSAGALSTPRILINSGIGPADAIANVTTGSQNITVPPVSEHINLPVGTQIKDHPIINLYFNTSSTLDLYPFAAPLASDKALFMNNRTGILTQGLQRTTSVVSQNVLTIKLYQTHGRTSTGSLGVSPDGTTIFTTTPWFTTPEDISAMAGVIDSLLASARALNIITPTTNATGAELIATNLVQGDHYVGTCKIGTDGGRYGGEAVVDTDTRVYGTENLFVVDASTHADLPTGHMQAIVMVVAEKAAERILAYA